MKKFTYIIAALCVVAIGAGMFFSCEKEIETEKIYLKDNVIKSQKDYIEDLSNISGVDIYALSNESFFNDFLQMQLDELEPYIIENCTIIMNEEELQAMLENLSGYSLITNGLTTNYPNFFNCSEEIQDEILFYAEELCYCPRGPFKGTAAYKSRIKWARWLYQHDLISAVQYKIKVSNAVIKYNQRNYAEYGGNIITTIPWD